MRISSFSRAAAGLLAVGAMLQLGSLRTADAAVITSSPALPVLGVPFMTSGGAGCFPAVAKCISAGSLTMTAPSTSTIVGPNEVITAHATYDGELTTLGGAPITPVTLTGTLEETVLDRSGLFETGTFDTVLDSLSLSGPVLGHTLTLELDPSHTSGGEVSITEVGTNENIPHFKIDSFFDVFVELSLNGPDPLTTTRGPIVATLAPEPASLVLLAPMLLGLVATRRRH
jgi:hypothetical protein